MWAKGKFDQLTFSGSETIAKMQKQSNPLFFWGLFKQELDYFTLKKNNKELLQMSAQGSKLLPEHFLPLFVF